MRYSVMGLCLGLVLVGGGMGAWAQEPAPPAGKARMMGVGDFPTGPNGFYVDQDKWLAINPNERKMARTSAEFPFVGGEYQITLFTVGENDGRSKYEVKVGDRPLPVYENPLSEEMVSEGPDYVKTWPAIKIAKGEPIQVTGWTGTKDGTDNSRARWSGLAFTPKGATPPAVFIAKAQAPKPMKIPAVIAPPMAPQRRGPEGNGKVEVTGELKKWHKITLTLNGPFAYELDADPNPFTDLCMTVDFVAFGSSTIYRVPGYFAADGQAGESSAAFGNKWRVHFAPDQAARWDYTIHFHKGQNAAVGGEEAQPLPPYDGIQGQFNVGESDKTGRDFRARGRLQYVGKHHLRFAETGEYFLKAGPDAPETFLAYREFDNTHSLKQPLKSWEPHIRDWKEGDPTWKDGKGKGMIGALNYLASKGVNAFSFLPYNVGGDGYNVWPLVLPEDKLHYDCSKLDQWGVVFDHAQSLGLYLHFKLQEAEIDGGADGNKKVAFDGGDLGVERKLYCRELIARFGHNLALNWNLGEENDQTPEQQRAMAAYLKEIDPYGHHRVIHTYPNQQDKVYSQLIGDQSALTGASLQNHWDVAHQRTLKWVSESAKAGRPWVVANDEQGSASEGVPPDLGYKGYDGKNNGKVIQSEHDIRKRTLWGNLMAGGAGVEYYFGYQLPENDLFCEDFRSRDRQWGYCAVALNFFQDEAIPFWKMTNANALIGNTKNDNSKYCLARKGDLYLIYLPDGGTSDLDLTEAEGIFRVRWFDPIRGGDLQIGSKRRVTAGAVRALGEAPTDADQDWLIVVEKR